MKLDPQLERQALTHSSYAHENRVGDNERLEFFGDLVLDLIVGEELMKRHPDFKEGDLSKAKMSVICNENLYDAALSIDLDERVLLGKSEVKKGSTNILSDAFEALVAAYYYSGGLENAREFVKSCLDFDKIENRDYKTPLQEMVQSKWKFTPKYDTLNPGDGKTPFVCQVEFYGGDMLKFQGSGTSKKKAEQEAARKALEFIRNQEKL